MLVKINYTYYTFFDKFVGLVSFSIPFFVE